MSDEITAMSVLNSAFDALVDRASYGRTPDEARAVAATALRRSILRPAIRELEHPRGEPQLPKRATGSPGNSPCPGLQQAREHRGLSRTMAAKDFGLHANTWALWERNGVAPRKRLEAVSALWGVSLKSITQSKE